MKCDRCLAVKAMNQFNDISGSGVVCDDCRLVRDSSKIQEAMREKTLATAKELSLMDPEGIAPEVGKVKGVLAEVYRLYGGPVGFAESFFNSMQELSKRKPMPSTVPALMIQFLKMHHVVEQAEEMIRAKDMDDEQLEREQEIAIMKLAVECASDPSKRAALAGLLGKEGLALKEMSANEVATTVVGQLSDDELEAELKKI